MQVAINSNGSANVVLSATDNWQHENNPLHYMCKLMKEGIPYPEARKKSQEYEKTYQSQTKH